MAGPRPACSYVDTHAVAHANQETVDPDAFAQAAYSYANRDFHCYPNGDTISLSYLDRDAASYSYTHPNLDSDAKATDCNTVSDPHSFADDRAAGAPDGPR